MSILIKGMEMPTSCAKCKMFGEYGCPLIGAVGYALTEGRRSADCPIVPVPEHGRLIDADFLLAEYDKIHIGKPGGARLLIANAPTIIPADKEGEG